MLLSLLLVVPSDTAAAQTPAWGVERFEAPEGTGISTAVARRMWGEAETVVMARADAYADALAAAPVAALLDAPLLLTERGEMPRHVWEQIEHFGPSRVVIMGGTAAVDDAVVAELTGRFDVARVERIAGPNRWATAAAALDFLRANGSDAAPFVTRGEGAGHIGGWEDAVAVSQHAARLRAPILLTRSGDVPPETAAALQSDEPDSITVVGGTAAVSNAVSETLWTFAPVDRLAGPSRFHTSTTVADATVADGADPASLWIVGGTSWQDAMVAGTTAGTLGGVLLYVNGAAWPTSTGREWIGEHTADIERIHVVADRSRLTTDVDFDLVDQTVATPPPAPPTGVLIRPDDDPQDVVDAHPPGSTFVFTSGLHRGAQVVPRDGDRFTGEPGAVLSGAVDIPAGGWVREADGVWRLDGVTFTPQVSTAFGMEEGREGEAIVTDLFAGRTRLRHTGDRGTLTAADQWHFDPAADAIYVREDPATLAPLEMSVTPWAIGGDSAAVDVEIDHVTVERYATNAKVGAIDAHNGLRWHIHHVTVRDSKSAGVRVGAGAVVSDSRLVHNGQVGITGGDHRPDGSQVPVVIERNQLGFNGEVGYRWSWEAGGVKLTNTVDSVYRQNWAHNNRGGGIWCDLDCRDPLMEGNLAEHNEQVGLFVEETVGAVVRSNISRGNGAFTYGDLGAGVWVSNSPRVDVVDNVLEGNRLPLYAVHNGIESGEHGALDLEALRVWGNDMRVDAYLPGLRVRTEEPERYLRDDLVWQDNTYRLRSGRDEHFWWGSALTIAEWQTELGFDLDGRFLSADSEPSSPPSAFTRGSYGAA